MPGKDGQWEDRGEELTEGKENVIARLKKEALAVLQWKV
jgi:hypothetical protein